MKRIWIICQKEIIDNLRDVRTVLSSLFSAIFTPALLLALIVVLGKTINMDPEGKALRLPVIGAENAPGLIQYFKQNNIEIAPPIADPEAAVRDGSEDVILVILPEYPADFRDGKPAPVRLIMDSSRQTSLASIRRVSNLIDSYKNTIAVLRLQARGVSPSLLAPVSVGTRDLATPQSQALIFLNMMPFLITLNVFTGGMGVIIDATAGERERGSLEPLLLNPARRREFVLGKLLASIPFALTTLIVVIFFFWIGFRLVPVEELLGFPMAVDGRALISIFLLFLPEVLLAGAIQILVATFTRSFKEAQTYLSFVPLIIGLPGMFLSFIPVRTNLIKMFIPTYAQSLLVNTILRGEAVEPSYWIAASVMTLLLAAVLILVAIRLYEGERVLFLK